ncbi:hypothetical protein JCM31826_11520 [Thermaurantimonas aggregans]|uniref:Ribosome maturation factor RimP n=1 Tax=Thermaurantimonas aggregans TaxID=2173829 RepID=A0A401XL09_9FLAO|nr:ribosome assembly cofactor RimP [Thermaurantimonas aggregans]MCX8148244.1 hypothetical protein [Thermaurantimonas aggregans]GCD77670.1 hypothetical protein JCM31826_11520 [Thermaurantimonas aggregans]
MFDIEEIKKIAEDAAVSIDGFLVSVKITDNEVIEILVDTDEGINLDQIVQVSRNIEQQLPSDISEKYSLMVSSPGVGEPLQVFRQYKKNIGRLAQITFKDGSALTARLIDVNETHLLVEEVPKNVKKGVKPKTTTPKSLPFTDISQTKIKVEFK